MLPDVHVCMQGRPWGALLQHPVRRTALDSLFVSLANYFKPGTDKVTAQGT